MASQSYLLTRIVAIVAGYDDSSWAALASLGLLRRARKDIEKGIEVALAHEDAGAVRIDVPPFQVTIPEAGPSKATCSCPSAGICQHILIAGLFLQAQNQGDDQPASDSFPNSYEDAKAELLAISSEQMHEWAGAATVRAAVNMAAAHRDVVVEEAVPIVIRFPSLNLVCRYIPGTGLDGLISSGSQRDSRKHSLAAVLAYQRQYGMALPEASNRQRVAEPVGGGARPREAMLTSIQQGLRQMVSVGLSHVSASLAERLLTLAVSARGGNLPRLALLLRAAADEAGLIVRRDAHGDEARLLLLASRIHALVQAIQNSQGSPNIALLGQSRSQYYEISTLELAGVAAYPWRTRSGYTGLTVLFWDMQNSQWLSWSQARPADQRFDPVSAYLAEGPWQGVQSPRQAAQSELKLMNARRNATGRLSSSSQTRALVTEATRPGRLAFGNRLFTDWSSLLDHAAATAPLGLRELHPLDDIVVVQPERWESRYYDEIEQTLVWTVRDKLGVAMAIELGFETYTESAIKFLETVAPPDTGCRLVARLIRKAGSIALHPITLLESIPERPSIQLAFENAAVSSLAQTQSQPQIADSREQEFDPGIDRPGDPDLPDTPSTRRMTALIRHIEELSEAGDGAMTQSRAQELRALAAELEIDGFSALGQLTRRLGENHRDPASELLQLRYLCELHREAMTIKGSGAFSKAPDPFNVRGIW